MISRHESDLKDNGYWLSLMTHLQSDAVPLKSAQCLRWVEKGGKACMDGVKRVLMRAPSASGEGEGGVKWGGVGCWGERMLG